MANILELSSQEAHDFLTASENYCTTELSEYIDFSSVLKIAEEKAQNIDIYCVATEAAACCQFGVIDKFGNFVVEPAYVPKKYLSTNDSGV